MRLWHYKLLPYLPKSQLLAQWRELNSIFKKQDKHILINYVYTYPRQDLYIYTQAVLGEFIKRNYKVKDFTNFDNYFGSYKQCEQHKRLNDEFLLKGFDKVLEEHKFDEHDNEYLTICYWNLREKYIRGQKDFTHEIWHKIDEFYKGEMKNGLQIWYLRKTNKHKKRTI